MKKILFCFLVTLLFSAETYAQTYKVAKPIYQTAIGVRAFPFGVSFKSSAGYSRRSFEIVGYFRDGFTGSFLYYWNFDLNAQRNLKLYAGGAAQLGYLNLDEGGGANVGVGAVIGADYKFLHLPINLSIDWQPGVRFGNENEFKGFGGLAARFTL